MKNGASQQISQGESRKMGMAAVERGETSLGISYLEPLFSEDPDPYITSYYAVCLAREKGDFQSGAFLCRIAMEEDPCDPMHYLNLGRVLLAANRKKEAIKAFRDGLLYGKSMLIRKELEKLGTRKLPVLPSLRRENPVNKCLGRLFFRLKSR